MSRILTALGRLLPQRALATAGRAIDDGAIDDDAIDGRAAKGSAVGGALIAWHEPGQPVWAPRDYAAFAREGFMQNPIVYRCVRMVAEAAASVPLLLYEGDEEIEQHGLIDLMARPSPDHTTIDFLESWYGFLLVSGNAYVEAVAVDGRLRELHVLRPDRMKVIPGADGWPEAFEYRAGGECVRFAAEPAAGVRPILHTRLFHPANDHYGMSPIEAAAASIDIHNAAGAWNKALLDNAARPSGALVYAARDGTLTGEQFSRLKSELELSFQGARNAGRPLLLEGGLDWKPLSLSPKDMDFVEAKHASAREIALALGVPPMLLGIPGDNTFGDDPYDPGGPTNKGITLKVYAEWLGVPADAALTARLRRIPDADVRAIYAERYWRPAGCDEFAAPLAFFHFDTAVNHGVTGAIRLLQKACGSDADGEIGPLTRAAVAAMPVERLLQIYAEVRRARYRALPHFWRFGRGWLRRVDVTLERALQEAAAQPAGVRADPSPQSEPAAKGAAPMTDASADATQTATTPEPAPTKWWGSSLTIWGALITALSTVLPALGPVVGIDITSDLVRELGSQLVTTAQAIGGLVGTILTIYGRMRATGPLERRDVSMKL